MGTGVGERFEVVVEGRPVLRFTPEVRDGEAGPGRVRVGIVLPEIGRTVEVSAHPAAALRRLMSAAAHAGVAPEAAERQAREVLEATVACAGAWRSEWPIGMQGLLGGASMPVLGAAFDQGAPSIGEVPRWAVPALAAGTARAAARAAFGPKATRPVISALARGLVAEEGATARLALHPLGLGLIGASVLDPDRLAQVLEASGDEPVPVDAVRVDDVAAGHSVVAELGATRTARLLLEAAKTPAGLGLFLDVARMWPSVSPLLPERLPTRLRALHDLCRSLVVTHRHPSARPTPDSATGPRRQPSAAPPVPEPVACRAPRRTAPTQEVRQRPVQSPIDRARARAFAPPVASRTVDATTPLPLVPRAAGIDGTEAGGLRLVLPRTCGDLERWGRLLRNCVGSFPPSVIAGESVLVGVFRGPELRACVEITSRGVIRQFLGLANRPVTPTMRNTVIGALRRLGTIDPSDPANHLWLMADDPPTASS